MLIQGWPRASFLLLTQFITWRQGRAEKLEPEAGQEPELPWASFPSPFPHPALLWANVFSPFHFLGVIHPAAPSQHGSSVSFPYAAETQALSVSPLPRPVTPPI